MIAFKVEYVSKHATSIVLYKNGVSLNKILVDDFLIDFKKAEDRKKFIMLSNSFWITFIYVFLEASNDSVIDDFFDKIPTNHPSPELQQQVIDILEKRSVHMDRIFAIAYRKLKKDTFIFERTGYADAITDIRDDVSDAVMEHTETDSNLANFLSLMSSLFSSKYRYLSDRQVAIQIVVKVVTLIIGILLTTLSAFLIKKVIELC